jgi:hypothetical protein
MVKCGVHTSNLSTQAAEAGGWQVQGYKARVSQLKKKKRVQDVPHVSDLGGWIMTSITRDRTCLNGKMM